MKTILFICQANVGRSQMAEGFYNAQATKSHAISAGIQDLREKYHGHPAPAVTDVMRDAGIDISHHEVKLVTKDVVSQADITVVLCKPEEVSAELVAAAKRIIYQEIEDPYEQTTPVVQRVRDEIKRVVTELLKMEDEVV